MRRTIKAIKTKQTIEQTIEPQYYYITDSMANDAHYLEIFFEEKDTCVEVYYENTNDQDKATIFNDYENAIHLIKTMNWDDWAVIQAKY